MRPWPSATHNEPAPYASPVGSPSTGIGHDLAAVAGTIRETVPSSRLATHTEPAPAAIAPGSRPTLYCVRDPAAVGVDHADPVRVDGGQPVSSPPNSSAAAATQRERGEGGGGERGGGAAGGRARACPGQDRPLGRGAQVGAGLPAVGPVLGQRPRDDGVERLGQSRPQIARTRGLLLEVRVDRRRLGGARERHLPGQALEQHAAERVDVGPAVDRLAADALRREVVQRPDELVGGGQALVRRRVLGDPEVDQIGVLAVAIGRRSGHCWA